MYCSHCGKQVPDSAQVCPFCKSPVSAPSQAEDWSRRIALAKQGDQDAMASLYEKTYSQVFYTIKSMIKDEDAVFDILQDAYIKAFTHLGTFDGDSKFPSWVRQIAANTARDYLKRKRPALFTELDPKDDTDAPIEERFVDSSSENRPDMVLDQAEAARLIREIIDSLPEDQRAVIGMYYYQEMPVKDIAETLGTSESAVKSRLLYGRRKIEAKVRDLEKRGTKLYGLSPLPFLLWLLQSQEARAVHLPSQRVLQYVLAQTAQTAAAATSGSASAAGASNTAAAGGTAAAGAGTATGGLGIVKLGLIGLASVAVIGAGAWGIHHLQEQPAANTTAAEDGAGTMEKGPESGQDPQTSDSDDAAIALYGEIISNAPDYTYTTSDSASTGHYRYSIFDLQDGDPVPTLLLAQETDAGNWYVRFFQYDPETDSVIQPEESLEEGSSGGGYHAGLAREADGNGVRLTETYGGSGDTEITRITLADGTLVREPQWSGKFTEVPEALGLIEIKWTEVSFHGSGQNETAEAAGNAEIEAKPVSPAGSESQGSSAEDGRIVFTGTVGTYSYEEVIALQGCPDPNAPWTDSSQTFRLIVLDTPQEMELQSGDPVGSPRSGMVRLISVAYAEGLEQYDGQHLTFSIDPSNTYWPSDASMPVGQPATRDVHVVG